MAGDYLTRQRQNGSASADVQIGVLDSGTKAAIVPVRASTYTVYVQQITFSPTTYKAGTLTFQDSAGVPIAVFSIPAAAPTTGADDPFRVDFGPNGTPLTLGTNLDCVLSVSGLAGRIHIEAYQKLGSVINVSSGASVS